MLWLYFVIRIEKTLDIFSKNMILFRIYPNVFVALFITEYSFIEVLHTLRIKRKYFIPSF